MNNKNSLHQSTKACQNSNVNSNTLKHRRTRRTTVTLEADVADYIQEAISKNRGIKEKDLINGLLRSGIRSASKSTATEFRINGFKSKLRPDVGADDLERLLDEI